MLPHRHTPDLPAAMTNSAARGPLVDNNTCEMAMQVLAYNLTRVLIIVSVKP